MNKQTIELQAELLLQAGVKFAKDNLVKHNTFATQKMERQLRRLRIPYQREFPVVVIPKKEGSKPKLYILDFYFKAPLNFAIEVDGGYHKKISQKEKDAIRDEAVEIHGLGKTFRFTNEQILDEKFDMISEILYTKSLKTKIANYWSLINPDAKPLPKKKRAGKKKQVYIKSDGSYLSNRDYYAKSKRVRKSKRKNRTP